MRKIFLKVILFVAIGAAVSCSGGLLYAQSVEISDKVCEEEDWEAWDDPQYGRAHGRISEDFYDTDAAGGEEYLEFVGNSANDNRTIRYGVDVSKWQGDIDWERAKAAGVEFAIIRVGHRGAQTGAIAEDSRYVENIEGAVSVGIPVGVYIYSQALTEEEAVEEANYVIARIYKFPISLPVVIDYEYDDAKEGRLYKAGLSPEEGTAVCNAFCRTVQAAGYTGMVYANKNMLEESLVAGDIADKYRIWLANYTEYTTYQGSYDFWQYSSTGDGAYYGMSSNAVDLDYWYDDGLISGMDYSPVFDAEYYANRYRDLKEAYGSDAAALLKHFISYGMKEGRQGSDKFSPLSYRNQYRDLRNAYGNDWSRYYRHYMIYGRLEGRKGTGFETRINGATTQYQGINYEKIYDCNYYLSHNPDVLAAYGYDDVAAIRHFVTYGMKEGRQAIITFDVNDYRSRYEDLQNAYGDAKKAYYWHFINYGCGEGRQSSKVFAVSAYKARYKDLQNAYGNDNEKYYMHYIRYGMSEGRIGI